MVVGGKFSSAGGQPSFMFAELVHPCAATVAGQSQGCVGAGGALFTQSLPWIGKTFRSRVIGATSPSIALVALGVQPAAVPLSTLLPQGAAGCQLLVMPDLLDAHLPVGGQLQVSFAIPDAVVLVGQVLLQQVVTFFAVSGSQNSAFG